MFYNLTKNYNKFINSIGTNIINGPFKGMKYISESVGSCHMPKILGIYENEIIPTLLKLFKNKLIYKHLLSEWREYEQSFLVCEPIIG